MIEVRFHGRGGQGAKIASRILGRSGFLSGLYAQDFALFGAERRGAPVASFTRLDREPIGERGYVEMPDFAVVMDDSLLKEAPEQVFHGVFAGTPLLVNADPSQLAAHTNTLPAANYIIIDLNAIARELIGGAYISAAAAAVAAKSIPAIELAALCDAVKIEIAEFGLPADLVEKNQAAARKAYAQAPIVSAAPAKMAAEFLETAWQAVPYLGSTLFVGPTIMHRGSAALRETGAWRTEHPEIDLGKCKRCFLCYLYCPEAAMTLDAQNFPHVDYDHCKGCMICFEECPTDAISRRLEA